LTVQGKNAIMMVFSSRQAIQGLRVFQRSGARFFYRRRRRSDHQCGVQQRGHAVASQGQHDAGGEHRAEAGAGAGEFHGVTSFRLEWRAGPELNRPVRVWHPAAELRRPYKARRWQGGVNQRSGAGLRLTRGGAAHSPRAARGDLRVRARELMRSFAR